MGFSNCKQNMRGQTSARSFWRPCSCRSTIDASSARSSWFLTLSFCNGSHSQVPNLQRATDINVKTFCSNMYGSDDLKHGILSKEVETHTLEQLYTHNSVSHKNSSERARTKQIEIYQTLYLIPITRLLSVHFSHMTKQHIQ
jgi:hypothetical protein